MEQPPHPMRLGENEQDYYVQGPTLARRSMEPGSGVSDPVGEQVR
jgi:NADH-quinone oxidoreductase subunit I